MRAVCRQQTMKSGRLGFKQLGQPKQVGTAAATARTTSTEDEASWDAALKAGVCFVDAIKPAMALLAVTLILTCIPATATAPVQLNEATVFPEGLTLCEPPIGGGHLLALPPMPDCHKSRGHPVDSVAIRLFVRQHRMHRGELYAMQRIKTTRCTHLGWFFYTTIFPDQVEQEALQHDEIQMIEDAMVATSVDPSRRPLEFHSGELQFQREVDMNVWTTRHEVQHATSYLRYRTRIETINYAFIIGQYVLYDTLAMTSDIADMEEAKYGDGRLTTAKYTLRWSVEETKEPFQCAYAELYVGTALRQGQRIVLEDPKMAIEIATAPIIGSCVSEKPVWPSTVCCYLVEYYQINATAPIAATSKLVGRRAKEMRAAQQWWNDTHEEELDEVDAVGEYLLARMERRKTQIWTAEKLAECEAQRMMQQIAMELLPMDPTLAVRLLTGDNMLAVAHARPMTAQV